MDTTYSRAVALAVPVFVSLIALEILIDSVRGRRCYRLADAINNLSCGIVSTGMRVFFGFIGIFVYEWLYQHAAPVHLPAANWIVWIFAFVFYDFCYYWQHRFGHTVGFFWANHSVHHQSEEFNLTTALRQPGTGAFSNWIFYVPMAICGVPIAVFAGAGLVQLFYQFWPHTRLINRMGVLDRLVQTPSNHRVHHAQNDIYLDKNYVGVFLLWDQLFGSYQEELGAEPPIFGVRGQLKSWNPVWANLHYYWIMAQDSWHAGSWRDKLYVWIAAPGWRPPDVAARFPKQPYDPHRDFVLFDPPRSLSLSLYALVQFAVLMIANMYFLATLNVPYFLFIIVSLLVLGGVLENRREFLFLETARLAAVAIAVLAFHTWFGGVHDARTLVSIGLFAALSLIWLLFTLFAAPLPQAETPAA